MEKYRRVKVIGTGSFGKCILARRVDCNEERVIKQIHIEDMNEVERKEALLEVSIMLSLKHPNIIQLVDPSFIQGGYLHIIMEYAANGDLCQAIDARTKSGAHLFDEDVVMNWFVQLTSALSYCHAVNVLHRDIKSQNVFLMRNGIVKLGDFGIAKLLSSTSNFAKTMVGTPYNLSPELCEEKPYGTKSDIWALGCLLYEILTLNHPFNGKNLPALILNILSGSYPPISRQYSSGMNSLVHRLLKTDPVHRPSADQVLKLDFVTNWCYQNLLEKKKPSDYHRQHVEDAQRETSPATDAPTATHQGDSQAPNSTAQGGKMAPQPANKDRANRSAVGSVEHPKTATPSSNTKAVKATADASESRNSASTKPPSPPRKQAVSFSVDFGEPKIKKKTRPPKALGARGPKATSSSRTATGTKQVAKVTSGPARQSRPVQATKVSDSKRSVAAKRPSVRAREMFGHLSTSSQSSSSSLSSRSSQGQSVASNRRLPASTTAAATTTTTKRAMPASSPLSPRSAQHDRGAAEETLSVGVLDESQFGETMVMPFREPTVNDSIIDGAPMDTSISTDTSVIEPHNVRMAAGLKTHVVAPRAPVASTLSSSRTRVMPPARAPTSSSSSSSTGKPRVSAVGSQGRHKPMHKSSAGTQAAKRLNGGVTTTVRTSAPAHRGKRNGNAQGTKVRASGSDVGFQQRRKQALKEAAEKREKEKRELKEHEERVRKMKNAKPRLKLEKGKGSRPPGAESRRKDKSESGTQSVSSTNASAKLSSHGPKRKANTATTAAPKSSQGPSQATAVPSSKKSDSVCAKKETPSLREFMKAKRKEVKKQQANGHQDADDFVVEIKLSDRVRQLSEQHEKQRLAVADESSTDTERKPNSRKHAVPEGHDRVAATSEDASTEADILNASDAINDVVANIELAMSRELASELRGDSEASHPAEPSAVSKGQIPSNGKEGGSTRTAADDNADERVRSRDGSQEGEAALSKHVIELRGSCIHTLGRDLFDDVYALIQDSNNESEAAERQEEANDKAMARLVSHYKTKLKQHDAANRESLAENVDPSIFLGSSPKDAALRMMRRIYNLICCERILVSTG